jgi:hypothetical protein
MTLAEIKAMEKDFLSVADVAGCLHMDQQLIRDQCERDIKWLGFPACRCGHSFRFPREGFIAWATGQTPMLVYEQQNQMREVRT